MGGHLFDALFDGVFGGVDRCRHSSSRDREDEYVTL